MNSWKTVARIEDLPENTPVPFEVDDQAIVLIKIGDRVYAIEDLCSHMEYPLHDGTIEDHIITCAYHGARFNIETGAVVSLPAFEPIKTFPVKIVDGNVLVNLDESS